MIKGINNNTFCLFGYNQIQSGTKPEDEYHIIGVASWYEDYKPFHDKWMLMRQRDERIDSILDD